jgi:hypothetical protein
LFIQRRHLIGAALLGSLCCGLLLPAVAVGDGGATHSEETFTEATLWFGPDECSGKTITGTGTETGTSYVTETANGGVHVRTEIQGSVDLYEATGPGPWDPQPGAFIGSWSYESSISDQAPPDEQGATTGIASGPLVLADGTTVRRKTMFHVTWDKSPEPPKLFFAKFLCSGS